MKANSYLQKVLMGEAHARRQALSCLLQQTFYYCNDNQLTEHWAKILSAS